MTWDAPLRLLGGIHFLVLTGKASWDAVPEVLREHRDELAELASRPVQTNEVQRCWVLLPTFLEAARRAGAEVLDFVELGSSAGFNLLWDDYWYDYANGSWGPEDAPLSLLGNEHRPVPAKVLAQRPHVRSRIGIDLHPVDVTTEEGVLLLKSFVWPDQPERLGRLERAIDAVRANPPEIIEGDLVEELPRVLADRAEDALTVVFHSAVLGYVDEGGRARLRSALLDASIGGGLAFVSTGAPRAADEHYWGMRLMVWPSGRPVYAADADYHGSWIDWAL